MNNNYGSLLRYSIVGKNALCPSQEVVFGLGLVEYNAHISGHRTLSHFLTTFPLSHESLLVLSRHDRNTATIHIYTLCYLHHAKAHYSLLRCRNNIVGRQCDRCATGFYGYPNCRPCDCSEAGTEKDVCDSITGRCLCKVPLSY